MDGNMNISRHSLIFGLSYALDIAGKNNLSHSKSTAYVSVLISRELGFDKDAALSLYYAALLHDIGISNEYALYEHCTIGAKMLKKLPLPQSIPDYVLYHHEFYDGSGPFQLLKNAIPQASQIIGLASMFDDRFGRATGEFDRKLFLEAQQWLQDIQPLFSQELIMIFADLMKRETFLLDYFNLETKYKLSSTVVTGDEVCYGYDEVLQFALCFADMIDRRSHFTSTHSHGIAKLAQKAAAHLGYDVHTQNKMYIAGLLHDIGKLHISDSILHKNGSLSPEERFEINKHTYYTRKILEQIPGLEDIVDYAANHHEKIDGTGYPCHITGEQLSELEKLMAICDVYQALTEKRPYRKTLMSEQDVWSIIDKMGTSGHFDNILVQKCKQIFPAHRETV